MGPPGGGPPIGGPPMGPPGGGPPIGGPPGAGPPIGPGGGAPGNPPGAARVPPSGSAAPPKAGAGAGPGPGPGPGAGGAATGAGAGGAGAAPGEGGATPSIVPFSAGLGATGGAGAAGASPGRGAAGGAFIMSMVPLNLGAAAPFRLNPHFVQVVAESSFCVPQFGQNTNHLPIVSIDQRAEPTHGLVGFSRDSNTFSSRASPGRAPSSAVLTRWKAAHYGALARGPGRPERRAAAPLGTHCVCHEKTNRPWLFP